MNNVTEQDKSVIRRQRLIRKSLARTMSILDRKSISVIEAIDTLAKEDDVYPFSRRALALDQVKFYPEDVEVLSRNDLKKRENLKQEISKKEPAVIAHTVSHYFKTLYDQSLSSQERHKSIFSLCLLIMTIATMAGGNVEDLEKKTFLDFSQSLSLSQLQKIYQYQLMARKIFLDDEDISLIRQEYQEGKGINWEKHNIKDVSYTHDAVRQDLDENQKQNGYQKNYLKDHKYRICPGVVPSITGTALRYKFKKLYNLKGYDEKTERNVFSICRLILMTGCIAGKSLRELRYDFMKSLSRDLSLSYMGAVYHKQLAARKKFLSNQVLTRLRQGQQIEM